MSTWESAQVKDALARTIAEVRADRPAMPADVAARVSARIAVETGAVGDHSAGHSSSTVTALPARGRWTAPRWLPVAAAVVVVAGAGGTYLLQHNTSSRVIATGESAAPGALTRGAAGVTTATQVTHSGAVIADATALDQHIRDLLDTTVSTGSSGGLSGQAAPNAAAGVTSETTTTAKSGTNAHTPAPQQLAGDADLVTSVSGGLAACLRELDPDHAVRAVDQIVFGGRPALAVVFAGENTSSASVFVIGQACSAAPPNGVLLYREVVLR